MWRLPMAIPVAARLALERASPRPQPRTHTPDHAQHDTSHKQTAHTYVRRRLRHLPAPTCQNSPWEPHNAPRLPEERTESPDRAAARTGPPLGAGRTYIVYRRYGWNQSTAAPVLARTKQAGTSDPLPVDQEPLPTSALCAFAPPRRSATPTRCTGVAGGKGGWQAGKLASWQAGKLTAFCQS
jgi:hypothetical protein